MKRIFSILILISCVAIITNLAISIYSLWKKQDLLVIKKQELTKEKQNEKEFLRKLSMVKKSEFIENEARNKLFMAKPDETEILIGQEKSKLERKLPQIPNWQKWIILFFGG